MARREAARRRSRRSGHAAGRSGRSSGSDLRPNRPLEGRVFFTELLSPFAQIELVRLRSNLDNSYKRLPVRLSGHRA